MTVTAMELERLAHEHRKATLTRTRIAASSRARYTARSTLVPAPRSRGSLIRPLDGSRSWLRPDAATIQRLGEPMRLTFGHDDVGVVEEPVEGKGVTPLAAS